MIDTNSGVLSSVVMLAATLTLPAVHFSGCQKQLTHATLLQWLSWLVSVTALTGCSVRMGGCQRALA